MCHVKNSQSLNLQFGSFSGLVFHTFIYLTLIHPCRGQSEIIGLSQPIVALVGNDIILPCYLDPVMDVFVMTVEWSRPDLNPRFVLVWRDAVELERKHPSYQGRTSLFTDELKQGNMSLKLSEVKRTDEGTYRCFVPGLDKDATVQVVVGSVSSPVIQVSKNNSAVVLQCESKGWYPEPEVLWLDSEGNLLSAGRTETVRGPDDLYTVSSRVTVEKRHSNNITCRVQQRNINQTRETHIHVPDDFVMVPRTPSSPSNTDVIIGCTVGAVFLLIILAAAFILWKWRKNIFRNKRKSLEEGSEHREEEKLKSKGDNTELHVVMRVEEESVPLMAGREEENSVDVREKKIKCQSEHDDSQTERETHQDHVVTKPELLRDMDKTEGEKHTSVITEEEPLISIEQETQEGQNMRGREEHNVLNKCEGDELKRGEDTGLQMSVVPEGQQQSQVSPSKDGTNLDKRKNKKNTLSSNCHTEQKHLISTGQKTQSRQDIRGRQEQKDLDKNNREKKIKIGEETGLKMSASAGGQQQSHVSLSKKETRVDETERKKNTKSSNSHSDQEEQDPKKENKQEELKNVFVFGSTGQKKEEENSREQIQLEAERQKVKNEKKLQSEMKERREKETKKKDLKIQRGNDRHLLYNRKLEDSEREEQSKTEKQKKENNDRLKESQTEEKIHVDTKPVDEEQKHNTELKPQKSRQHVLENKQEESKSEHDDKKEKDLKMKSKKHQSETEAKVPSVNRDITSRSEIKMLQEGKDKEKQEQREIIETNKTEDTKWPLRSRHSQDNKLEESKDKSLNENVEKKNKLHQETQRRTEVKKHNTEPTPVESQEGEQGEMETKKAVDSEETQRMMKEEETLQLRKEVKEPERKLLGSQEETTERRLKYLKGRRVKSHKEQQEEMMKIDTPVSSVNEEGQRNVMRQKRQHQLEMELHVNQQQPAKKRKRTEDDKVQIQETDTDVTEPQRTRRKLRQNQSLMCHKEQQKEMMEINIPVSSVNDEGQRNVMRQKQQHQQEMELHVYQQQPVRRRKGNERNTVHIQKTFKIHDQYVEEQDETLMEVVNMEKDVTELERTRRKLRQNQSLMCKEEQQEKMIKVGIPVGSVNNDGRDTEETQKTEQETEEGQDIRVGQERNDWNKGESEELKRGENTSVKMSVSAGGQQQSHVSLRKEEKHVDETERKKNTKPSDSRTDQVEHKTKKENKQEELKNVFVFGSTGQKKEEENRREQIQLESERQKVENEKKLQSEIKERREKETKKKDLKICRGNDRHLLYNRKLEDSERETQSETEKQKKENNDRLKDSQTEEKIHVDAKPVDEEQKHNTELKPQKSRQHVLENKQEESKTEHDDKKEKAKKHQSETENKVPSVNRDITSRSEIKMLQEGKDKEKQEQREMMETKKTVDTEETLRSHHSQDNKLEESKDDKSLNENVEKKNKLHQETQRRTEVKKHNTEPTPVESQEGEQGEMKTKKAVDSEETQRMMKEEETLQLRKEVKEPERKLLGSQEETTERRLKYLKGRRVKSHKEQQEEMMEVDEPVSSVYDEGRRNVMRQKQQHRQEMELHVYQQQPVRKMKGNEGDTVQIQETFKIQDEYVEEQDETLMEVVNMEQDVTEPQRTTMKLRQNQSLMCQEEQEEEMDVDI